MPKTIAIPNNIFRILKIIDGGGALGNSDGGKAAIGLFTGISG